MREQTGNYMDIILAKSAGFCFGVQKAVDKVNEKIGTEKNLSTYGPIIHNEQVVDEFKKQGVNVVNDLSLLDSGNENCVVIRSHGIDRDTQMQMENMNLKIVDATCPFVKRIHRIVEKDSAEGKKIVIIGNSGHPEVEGIKGWSVTNANVIETEEDIDKLSLSIEDKISIVSQTTFNHKKFKDLVENFVKKGYDISVVNTICNATEERQTEAREIASKVDVMIVIGGAHSSNSQKLYEICKEECENTIFIQTLEDLKLEQFVPFNRVGITAGASTPNNIIEEVQNYVRINF